MKAFFLALLFLAAAAGGAGLVLERYAARESDRYFAMPSTRLDAADSIEHRNFSGGAGDPTRQRQ